MKPLFSFLAALLFPSRESTRVHPKVAPPTQKRKTIAARYCGKLHLLATGEPVAHQGCKILPAEALRAEAEGQWLRAERSMARHAASGPLVSHPGIWKVRRGR